MSIFAPPAHGTSGVDTGDIGHSLRFRSGSSTYLSKTFGSAGNRKTFTLSEFFKVAPKVDSVLCSARLDDNNRCAIYFGETGTTEYKIKIVSLTGGVLSCNLQTSCVFRDPTSHVHILVAFDTTQATAANRVRVWVNGVEVTSFSTATYPAQNYEFFLNSNVAHALGRLEYSTPGSYFDGYRSRICWVGGSALTPSSFGYLNTEINEWVSHSASSVKAVVDAGGTNSFMLDFDDATSLTTLGYDKSSKGNNWTLNNFSLTAGTTYDHMLDVPGNSYATLNAIYPSAASITNANLTSSTTAVRATMNALLFDCKWEVTAGGSAVTAGVISATGTTNTTSVTANKTFAFRLTTAGALDYKNVTDAGSWTSITTGLSGEQYPYGVTQAANWNFGQAPLHASATYQSAAGGYFYDTTTGFKALCQRNMPDPAILNPEKHFDVVTYTGTAATKSITGLLFAPDLVEMKSRGRALDWAYYDSVRGVEKRLESNNTDAEVTGDTTGLTAFNSDGWTMGALDQINGTTATNSFVGYAWKAGGAAVTNNAGSISSQVSANVDAGFSIVTYTGTGANATVGHGLGKAPGLVITKGRNSADSWFVLHKDMISALYYLQLQATIAQTNNATVWNSTSPTSTVFSIGTNSDINGAADTYVAYCFAEIAGYSRIFSYTGNGSADGPYVDCGFKPKYVLIKGSSLLSEWYVWDAARNAYNVMNLTLNPNQSVAEYSAGSLLIDATASGFKIRDTVGSWNSSGHTYIGIAFADVAGKYSLGR